MTDPLIIFAAILITPTPAATAPLPKESTACVAEAQILETCSSHDEYLYCEQPNYVLESLQAQLNYRRQSQPPPQPSPRPVFASAAIEKSTSTTLKSPAPTAPPATPTPLNPTPTNSTQKPPDSLPGNSLNADKLFDLVNQYRQSKGLAPFQKDSRLCELAASRAPELHREIFDTRTMHAGMRARQADLPYKVTENMISQQTEEKALNWWIRSSIHRKAILSSYQYSCTACQGNACAQLFSNL